MAESAQIELLEKTLDRMLHWIAAADAKVAPVLAVTTAMLGVLAAIAPAPTQWTLATISAATTAVGLLVISLVFLFTCAFPRTTGPNGSLVFFGGITERDEATFLSEVTKNSRDEYLQDLARQCYRNAEIAGKKFQHIKISMAALLLSVVPWLLAVYLLH